MWDLPVLPGGGLALLVLTLVELVPPVLVRAGWRLPVLAGVQWAGMRWARLARGVLLRTLRVGGVRNGTPLCLAIWRLTVRPLVEALRAVWS